MRISTRYLKCLSVVVSYAILFSADLVDTQSLPDAIYNRGCIGIRGQFPHEAYCHKYYNCWDGRATIEDCPGELLFNAASSTCDYPDAVSCGGRIRNLAPFIAGGTCLKQWGTFPDPTDCTAFYECDHGRAFRKVCPFYTAFDERVLVCVHAHDVDCAGRGGVYGTLAPPVYPLPDSSSRIRIQDDRNRVGTSGTDWDRRQPQQGPSYPGRGSIIDSGRGSLPAGSEATGVIGSDSPIGGQGGYPDFAPGSPGSIATGSRGPGFGVSGPGTLPSGSGGPTGVSAGGNTRFPARGPDGFGPPGSQGVTTIGSSGSRGGGIGGTPGSRVPGGDSRSTAPGSPGGPSTGSRGPSSGTGISGSGGVSPGTGIPGSDGRSPGSIIPGSRVTGAGVSPSSRVPGSSVSSVSIATGSGGSGSHVTGSGGSGTHVIGGGGTGTRVTGVGSPGSHVTGGSGSGTRVSGGAGGSGSHVGGSGVSSTRVGGGGGGPGSRVPGSGGPRLPGSSAGGDSAAGPASGSRDSSGVAGITGITDKESDGTGPEKQYERPLSTDATFRCPHPRGLYAFALDCTKFWLCREYRPSLLKCPMGQLFDLASLTCTQPEKAQCSSLSPRS